MKRCECGKVMAKWRNKCRTCEDERMEKMYAENEITVKNGVCLECGSKLVRNGALHGWWQCVQYGNWKNTHGDVNKANCGFQIFTK